MRCVRCVKCGCVRREVCEVYGVSDVRCEVRGVLGVRCECARRELSGVYDLKEI